MNEKIEKISITKERKVYYIDVGKMSKKELCNILGLEYIPWYKSSVFWSMFLGFV